MEMLLRMLSFFCEVLNVAWQSTVYDGGEVRLTLPI